MQRFGLALDNLEAADLQGHKPIDAKAIGKDLGVRYVLEGSVQPSGDRMRVNAQLIDAESGAHLWAEQFDTPRADLLQTQDAIVTHLAHAINLQLIEAEGARVKQKPAANRGTEDLALQRIAGALKAGFIGKEADAAYALCEQALAIDPNNVRALGGGIHRLVEPARLIGLRRLAILRSPHNSQLAAWYGGKAQANFGLKRCDQAIEQVRQAIAIRKPPH
jgi:hypothetical protein